MERNVLSRAAEFIKAQRQKKRWTKAVSAMAAVVVFCTTYALILPAITLQAECGKEDHTHSDACYTVETITPPAHHALFSGDSAGGRTPRA